MSPTANSAVPHLAPTTWTIDVDAVGAFRSSVAPPLPLRHGNFRLTVGDTLIVNLPAGSLANQSEVRLVVINGVNEESVLTGVADVLGNLRFEWLATANSGGPCSFCFDYVPFPKSANDHPTRCTSIVNRIIVSPRICINGKHLPVGSLAMQTVMSRCIGPLDTWVARLQHATADLHYNVIHFTPVQVTGESGSCYSLADQLEIAPELLPVGSKSSGFDLLKNVIEELESRYGQMSTSDIVLNHTANDTHWIPHHPECGYNERNSPHLAAAIELDVALQKFSLSIAEGHYRGQGVSEVIEDENSLQNLRRLVQDQVLNPFRLGEWFSIDFDGTLNDFRNSPFSPPDEKIPDSELRQRLVDECLKTVGVARHKGVCPNGEVTSRLFRNVDSLKSFLHGVQDELYRKSGEVNDCILNAIEGYVRWERLQCRKGPIGKTHWDALVPRYFTPIQTKLGESLHLANNGWVMDWDAEKDFAAPGSLVYLSRSLVAWSDCIKLRYGEGPSDCPFLWNLMRDYSVKTAKTFHGIRLDNCHSTPIHVAKYCLQECRRANPNLWVYAELFTGKRETDLKFERELGLNALIREAMQSYSAGNLGHHIREFGGRPIGAFDSVWALNRLSDGLRPLLLTSSPSLFFDCTHDNETPQQKRTAIDALPNAAAVAASVSAIGSCRGYDELVPKVLSVVTEKRHYHTYESSGSGSRTSENGPDFAAQARLSTSLHAESSRITVKGSWDGWKGEIELTRRHGVWIGELYPNYYPASKTDFKVYQYKFVAEGSLWFHDPALPHSGDEHGNINNTLTLGHVTTSSDAGSLIDARRWSSGMLLPGIMEAKKHLNEIHQKLAIDGFTEINVETRGDHILVITRHQPETHRMCIFFIHTAFSPSVLLESCRTQVVHEIDGKVDEIVLETRLIVPEDSFFVDEPNFINGLTSRLLISSHSKDLKSKWGLFDCRYDDRLNKSILTLKSFLPGSVVVVMSEGFAPIRQAVAISIQDIGSIFHGIHGTKISRFEELHAFSYLLFSCCNEERDRSRGARGCYEVGCGSTPYAGIAGFIPLLDEIRYTNNMQHPLVQNVLAGDWLFEYSADRLDTDKDDAFSGGVVVVLLKVASWLREISSDPLRHLPRNVLASYFDWIICSLYSWVASRMMSGMPEPLRSCTDPFLLHLCHATLQFYSYVPSSPLLYGTNHPSLCAGLPHFSTEYMRNWGRDTFIALKGCLLATGRYQEAREEILGFARVMRHGLIPNLLDSCNNPRYNARDATWFFLQAIQDYCAVAPEGNDFLKAAVSLKYAETLPEGAKVETLGDLMHFILSQHAKGIEFREWNAGPKIDSCMKDEGFNVTITCDRETGFIFGGNRLNCGTWMDKMGSSSEAGTVGIPATPRDGAAVEIIGLLKSTLRFVTSLPSSIFDYKIADETTGFTYDAWNSSVQKSFESVYYVSGPDEGLQNPAIDQRLINRTQIVRDSLHASEAWRDYQLRPNFCTALAVAPELVSKQHALAALENASSVLFRSRSPYDVQQQLEQLKKQVGVDAVAIHSAVNSNSLLFTTQLGLKTLDPSDLNYRPDYNNDDRSSDPSVSHGYNYHNGPEWVWPVGHFLDALFYYMHDASNEDTMRYARFYTMRYLLLHRQYIATDPWLSLPEVTDHDGKRCHFSCSAQAWSIGTLLAFLSTVAAASSSYSQSTAHTTSTLPSPTGTPSESPKAVEAEIVKTKK